MTEVSHPMSVSRSSLIVVLAGALLGALLLAAAPADAAYSTCRLASSDQQPRSGKPTYNLKLQEQGTSCTTAKRVMRAYHGCRSRTGLTCSRRLLSRWTCTARRTSRSSVQFYASYTCRGGSARVKGTYQQNT